MEIIFSKYKAVLFGLDGVVLDNMNFHYKAWADTLSHYALSPDPADIYQGESSNSESFARRILEEAGLVPTRESVDVMLSYKKSTYSALGNPALFPEIKEAALLCKKEGIKTGIVTDALREEVTHELMPAAQNSFDLVVTGDMVSKCKPHPEPYLHACKTLKIQPASALAVESTPHGIQSAISAGCACVAIETALPSKYLSGAGLTVKNHAELLELFSVKKTLAR